MFVAVNFKEVIIKDRRRYEIRNIQRMVFLLLYHLTLSAMVHRLELPMVISDLEIDFIQTKPLLIPID